MTDDDSYRVRIEGPGVNFDLKVPSELGKKVVVSVLTGQVAQVPPAVEQTKLEEDSQVVDQSTKTSIREFMDKYHPKRSPDKITTFGYYLNTHDSKTTFKRADIVACFERAAEPIPKNLSRDINWTVKAGWIAPKTGEKGSYYVTHTGTTVVTKGFPRDMVDKTRQPKAKPANKGGTS